MVVAVISLLTYAEGDRITSCKSSSDDFERTDIRTHKRTYGRMNRHIGRTDGQTLISRCEDASKKQSIFLKIINTVKSRNTGPKNNGNPLIMNAKH